MKIRDVECRKILVFRDFFVNTRLILALSVLKQVGNCRTRKSETSTFQNFFPIEKILIFKKIRSIFVWIEVFFSCSSVYLTSLLSKVVNEGQICGRTRKNHLDPYKIASIFLQNQYFLDRKKVLKT